MDIVINRLEQYFTESDKPNLPFHIKYVGKSKNIDEIHCHNYFQIILIDKGEVIHHIEYAEPIVMNEYQVSVIFPKQIHQISFFPECKGVILMFDEALFCSDILKKELSAYNQDLYKKLNYIKYDKVKYENIRNQVNQICQLYENISPIKKEQIRFYIKILLLQLIEDVHEKESPEKILPTINIYAKYKTLIDEQFSTTKTVANYAAQIGISTKRLNNICKQEAAMTALAVLHERILVEARRMLLFSGDSIKEIAYKLGFTSPSAFNKFIYSKTSKTPTELKNSLSQKDKQKEQMDNLI